MSGRCLYCFYPEHCQEIWGRPVNANYLGSYLELERALKERAMSNKPEEKPEEKTEEKKKTNWLYAMSVWTYWQLMQIVIAIVKAINKARSK